MIVVLLLVFAVAVLAGCGGGATVTETVTVGQPPATSTTTPEEADDYQFCKETLGPSMDALEDLRSRLDAGMTYDDYASELSDINVEFNRAGASLRRGECHGVWVALEGALNNYIEANSLWNDCLQDLCSDAAFNKSLQPAWGRASRALSNAQIELTTLEFEAGE
jgi:hypothetical protein